ncbi:adenylosuccinate lyase [Lacinutrix neustonica]|uniref:Adenylosuccinate lyase n=1 Tax=Lacinutrix neustonica TaxID=2980107 RepID=A0A9E8MX46_9FLAO|nr:adenylosuccinate lyase [Lacinutrix neustonica]
MTTEALYQELDDVNHSRDKRLYYANVVLENPGLIPKLLDILFMVDDKRSSKAAWVLEYLCDINLEAIIPYLDVFTEHLHKVHLDSAQRPVAKVCENLAKAYYGKGTSKLKQALLPKHKEKIIEACFDWMLNDAKVAPKAYSMNTLFLLGSEYHWIHPELIGVLERDFHMQSCGYKARAETYFEAVEKQIITLKP